MKWFALCLALAVGSAHAEEKRIIGYFAEWPSFSADKLPADKLTHINYAFAVIDDGVIAFKDEAKAREKFSQLRAFKQKHPHIRTLISIGGWTDSHLFSDVALTEESRRKFAKSCVDFISAHGFDGVDIDWEYPGGGGMEKNRSRPEDTKNFTLLLAGLRRQLDKKLLTIAAPAGGQVKNIELDKVHPLLDFINLMTYDFAGPWGKTTGFNAPLFAADEDPDKRMNADAAVRAYLTGGVPADKLVLGVPFYGRAWGGVKDVKRGLFQPHSGKPPRAPGADGGFSYRNIAQHYADKAATRHWQDQAKVPWLFNPKTGLVVSYDDAQSLKLKAQYARDHNLGGVMIWELSEDDESFSLLSALHDGLHGR